MAPVEIPAEQAPLVGALIPTTALPGIFQPRPYAGIPWRWLRLLHTKSKAKVTVDGEQKSGEKTPPFGMNNKPGPYNYGINYQPQLVNAGFFPINRYLLETQWFFPVYFWGSKFTKRLDKKVLGCLEMVMTKFS